MTVAAPPTPSAPRAQNKLRYREAILDAAVEVFSARGYDDAQMGEIAQRAQVAVGTLYNCFGSKENLYREMLMSHVSKIAREFDAIFESDAPPLEKLMRYIRHKGEVLQSNPTLVRLYFSEVAATEQQTRTTRSAEFRDLYRRMMGKLARTFQQGIDRGDFADCDAFSMGVALASMTNAFVRIWMNHPELKPSYPDRVETIARIFFGPILREKPPGGSA